MRGLLCSPGTSTWSKAAASSVSSYYPGDTYKRQKVSLLWCCRAPAEPCALFTCTQRLPRHQPTIMHVSGRTVATQANDGFAFTLRPPSPASQLSHFVFAFPQIAFLLQLTSTCVETRSGARSCQNRRLFPSTFPRFIIDLHGATLLTTNDPCAVAHLTNCTGLCNNLRQKSTEIPPI